MAQGMQNPISNYGNFGQVMANQWNAAQERALRSDLADQQADLAQQQIDLQERGLEMKEEAFNYELKNALQMDEIAKQKFELGREKRELYKDYKDAQDWRVDNREWYDYIDLFGIGKDSYWFPEHESFEDWTDKAGRDIPDEFDLQVPDDPTRTTLQYFSQMDPTLESSLGDPGGSLMNLLQR